MKTYLFSAVILALTCISGCSQSNSVGILGYNQNEHTAYDYMQAGMFDDAEKAYQKEILNEKDKAKSDLHKDSLLSMYITTGQLDKADKYASVAYFSTDKLNTSQSDYIASALFDAKKFNRAYYHFTQTAIYSSREKSDHCNEYLIETYQNAYSSALNAKMTMEANNAKLAAEKILDSAICMSSKEAQLMRIYFN